jgi:hypothetical protein
VSLRFRATSFGSPQLEETLKFSGCKSCEDFIRNQDDSTAMVNWLQSGIDLTKIKKKKIEH